MAAAAAHHFNPSSGIHIHARHGNIKEPENDVEWIGQFDLVMGALDNLDARRHVNKLCCAAGVPLIESGTQGYLGQVQPMRKVSCEGRTGIESANALPPPGQDVTACFDCFTKEAPKTYPVCTIRATPSEPIHCIVWAKSYLFP